MVEDVVRLRSIGFPVIGGALLLLVPLFVFGFPGGPVAALTARLQDTEFLVLGEVHQRPESAALVGDVAASFTESGRCVRVALEIAATEQGALDRVMAGKAPVSAVRVHPIIDHAGFRDLLARLSGLVRQGRFVRVFAVDAPAGAPGGRDAWMAGRLARLPRGVATQTLVFRKLVREKHRSLYEAFDKYFSAFPEDREVVSC